MNNTPRITITNFGLSVDEILKSVFAESAWRALRGGNKLERPLIINHDNKMVLIELLTNSYVYLCSQLLGYIKEYDFNSVKSGVITLSLAIPPHCSSPTLKAIMQQLERTLTCHLLSQCYDTEGYEKISHQYLAETKTTTNNIKCTLLNPTPSNI